MDYTDTPAGPPSNEHPNQHDYDQLVTTYTHLDSSTTLGALVGRASRLIAGLTTSNETGGTNASAEWGREVHRDSKGRADTFEKDLGNGEKVVTHIFWAN